MTTAKQEFIVGNEKYTPQAATHNNVKGFIWTKRILEDGAWLHDGVQHVGNRASESTVIASFYPDIE